MHACPITEEGRNFFDLNDEKLIAVINPEEGDGAGLANSQGSSQNQLPEEKWTVWKLANSEEGYPRKLLLIGQQLSLKMTLRKLL